MHFLISLGTFAGFLLFAGLAGFAGGIYTGVAVTRPRQSPSKG